MNRTYLVITELFFLLIFIFLISIIFYPITPYSSLLTPYSLCIMLWGLFVIFGYLFGEFEPTTSVYFGFNIRTQSIFLSTIITYLIIFLVFDQLPQFNLLFWIIIWLYLNLFTPIFGFLIRRIFLAPVVLVSDINDKEKLLKWWGYNTVEQVTKSEFNQWLTNNSNISGRIATYNLILIDVSKKSNHGLHGLYELEIGGNPSNQWLKNSDPSLDTAIGQLSDKYFVNFTLVKSYRLLDYLCGFHTRVITKYPGRCTEYRIKRLIDFFICTAALILSAPLFLFIILCIKLDSPGPVFYRHRRLGKNMKPFDLLKLRTMYQDADQRLEHILSSDKKLKEEFEKTFKLKKDPRVTRTGKIIRQLSFDELPQILNVINSDMSLVGPRPIVEKEIPYYQTYSLDIFRVLPGVTGLWQTSGRTETTYEKRVKLDTQYVCSWSLLNDLKLLIKTIPVVISQRGAY